MTIPLTTQLPAWYMLPTGLLGQNKPRLACLQTRRAVAIGIGSVGLALPEMLPLRGAPLPHRFQPYLSVVIGCPTASGGSIFCGAIRRFTPPGVTGTVSSGSPDFPSILLPRRASSLPPLHASANSWGPSVSPDGCLRRGFLTFGNGCDATDYAKSISSAQSGPLRQGAKRRRVLLRTKRSMSCVRVAPATCCCCKGIDRRNRQSRAG